MITIRLLGSVDIRGAGGSELDVLLRQPKRVALLSYLAAATPPGFRRRDTLMGLFWPESTQEQARHALSQALHVLRQELGEHVLLTRGEGEVALNTDCVSCDVWAFETAVAEGDLDRAVALYRGPLLHGFAPRASAEFDQWMEGERDRLARSYARALEQLAAACAGRGERQEAVGWRHRLVAHDPYSTNVTLRLMEALEAVGDRAGALAQADRHATRLKEELEAEPSPDVAAYAERLRRQPVAHAARAADPLAQLHRALSHRYTIERELGSGGMATVYLARDLKHERHVALKVLRPELAASVGPHRFLREIQIAAQLNHPNILPLHDSGEVDGTLYYTMPYVDGESLRDRLIREPQLPIEHALHITREVADALGYAHEQGIIHRDIKPENILFEAGHAVVSDFGIARAVSAAGPETITAAGLAIGTPAYMSPEQGAGTTDLDGRSDLYSLGCVLYEMLTGETPYLGNTPQAIIAKKLSDPVPRVSVVREAVPVPIEKALTKVLSKTPVDRHATAEQFTKALSIEWASVTRAPAKRRASRRVIAALAGGAMIAVAAVAVSQYRRSVTEAGPPRPDRPYTVLATVSGSADSAMRETVEFLMRSGLDMAHVVQTVPSTEVDRVLALMERPPMVPLDPTTARQVAERYGVSSIVLPRLDVVGNGFLVAVRVEDAATGEFRAEAARRADNADVVVETVDAVVKELRRDLGETRATLANVEPLPELLTPSLEALRRYRHAGRLMQAIRFPEAVAKLREALALDPAFAEARATLAACYRNMGHSDSALVERERALETPERLSAVRRRNVESELRFGGDVALWDESMFRSGLVTSDALRLSYFNFDSALTLVESPIREQVRRNRRFDPNRQLRSEGIQWVNALGWAIASGRLEELAALRDSLGVEPSPHWHLRSSLALADWDRADSLRVAFPNEWFSFFFNSLDAARGRIRESHTRSEGHPALILEVVYGVPAIDTRAALTDRRRRTVWEFVMHGVRAALVGDTTEAKRVSTRLRAARDSATSDVFERAFEPMFALLNAGVAIRRDDWRAAADILEPSASRVHLPGYAYGSGIPYVVHWVLADTYTHLGQLDGAVRELEALLRVSDDMAWHALAYSAAHFKLGQHHAQLGNTGQALKHFTTFLDTFTDPDPEYVWMVKEARAEVERLGGDGE